MSSRRLVCWNAVRGLVRISACCKVVGTLLTSMPPADVFFSIYSDVGVLCASFVHGELGCEQVWYNSGCCFLMVWMFLCNFPVLLVIAANARCRELLRWRLGTRLPLWRGPLSIAFCCTNPQVNTGAHWHFQWIAVVHSVLLQKFQQITALVNKDPLVHVC